MPYAIHCDESLGCAFVRYQGQVTVADLLETMAALQDPRYAHLHRRMHDLRELEASLASRDVMQLGGLTGSKFLELSPGDLSERRSAIVAAGDLHFGLARMLTAHSSQPPVGAVWGELVSAADPLFGRESTRKMAES